MRNVYPRGPLSLTWWVTLRNVHTRGPLSLTWPVTERNVYPRGQLSLTWFVTVRNVYPRCPTESDLASNCEKCLSQRSTEVNRQVRQSGASGINISHSYLPRQTQWASGINISHS